MASQISATDLSYRINHQGPDDELRELADTFDSMIDRLQQSFEQQRQFLQDASHELRTPLAAIRTNIEVAEMDQELDEDEVRAAIRRFADAGATDFAPVELTTNPDEATRTRALLKDIAAHG